MSDSDLNLDLSTTASDFANLSAEVRGFRDINLVHQGNILG